MQAKLKHVTAAILCGGKSRRMGFDKAFLMDQEHYLLLQTVRALESLFDPIILVSNTKAKFENRGDFEKLSVLEDLYTEKGPLGGIASALKQVQTEYIFAMACDMPLTDPGLIGRMYGKLGQKQVLVCSHQGRPEPLFAFYHSSCLPVFEAQIGKGELRPRRAYSFLDVGVYELKDGESKDFVNLNTPEDLKRWSEKSRYKIGG